VALLATPRGRGTITLLQRGPAAPHRGLRTARRRGAGARRGDVPRRRRLQRRRHGARRRRARRARLRSARGPAVPGERPAAVGRSVCGRRGQRAAGAARRRRPKRAQPVRQRSRRAALRRVHPEHVVPALRLERPRRRPGMPVQAAVDMGACARGSRCDEALRPGREVCMCACVLCVCVCVCVRCASRLDHHACVRLRARTHTHTHTHTHTPGRCTWQPPPGRSRQSRL